jgi:putative Ca2+/H+ antiporter (TMEM165/GDT1 family)
MAELGDKTMLTVVFLTTAPNFDPLGIFLGAILALSVVNGIGVFFGETMTKSSFKDFLEPVSGILFILIGILIWFY